MFEPADHPDLLIGIGTPDDAAVYRLDDDHALVVTTDFFTPIVDDPYSYGAIAAANALSDVYAMGARPVLALNIAALPPQLPIEVSNRIMLGLAETVREAGAVIAGGHTIQDQEPKVGLAVVGFVHPQRLLTKAGARPGDTLVLTKPLGTGCITTAAKNDRARDEDVAAAIEWMVRLNRTAADAAIKAGTHALTDITGFGFLGHASELAAASGVTLQIAYDDIPFLPGARAYAEQWIFPGGSIANAEAFAEGVRFTGDFTEAERMLLFDAQTSGGLLAALPPESLPAFEAVMQASDTAWWTIGHVRDVEDAVIEVTR